MPAYPSAPLAHFSRATIRDSQYNRVCVAGHSDESLRLRLLQDLAFPWYHSAATLDHFYSPLISPPRLQLFGNYANSEVAAAPKGSITIAGAKRQHSSKACRIDVRFPMGKKMLHQLIYLNDRNASFLISLREIPLLLVS